jgi:hypothetical protein
MEAKLHTKEKTGNFIFEGLEVLRLKVSLEVRGSRRE